MHGQNYLKSSTAIVVMSFINCIHSVTFFLWKRKRWKNGFTEPIKHVNGLIRLISGPWKEVNKILQKEVCGFL